MIDENDPPFKAWMLKVERRLAKLEAYMKVIGGTLGVGIPVGVYLLVEILKRVMGGG